MRQGLGSVQGRHRSGLWAHDHWTKKKFWHLTIDHDCLKEFEVQKNDEVSEEQKWDEMLVTLTDYDYADWMVWMIFWLSL